jgi:hypothetical protein
VCEQFCVCRSCFLVRLMRIEHKQDLILKGEKRIMAALDDALAALQKIDDATTKQAAVLQAEGDTLQTISDEIDTLIKNAGTSVPPELLSKLQAQADKVQGVSDSIDKQAAFSKEIAAKGVTNPVPVPVPTPTASP